ncbi:MAG: hypothetical protein M1812_007748 [Candelaria pacifica]|nr:MAG: hypothetical protein M1812_007748 [Candelaria pacifica]
MDLHRLKIVEWSKLQSRSKQDILEVIKRVEKKTFPTNEVFQFDQELKKHNTYLVCAMKEDAWDRKELVAYMVYLRIKRLVLLHKICVREQYRRKGIARLMLDDFCKAMQKSGCDSIQLWVDEARVPARRLYSLYGFVQVMSVNDYYSLGRTGLKMVSVLHDR